VTKSHGFAGSLRRTRAVPRPVITLARNMPVLLLNIRWVLILHANPVVHGFACCTTAGSWYLSSPPPQALEG